MASSARTAVIKGLSRLSKYAASPDISDDAGENTLSTADGAGLLAELSQGRLLNQEHTEQLLSSRQDTNYEDLIPAAVHEITEAVTAALF